MPPRAASPSASSGLQTPRSTMASSAMHSCWARRSRRSSRPAARSGSLSKTWQTWSTSPRYPEGDDGIQAMLLGAVARMDHAELLDRRDDPRSLVAGERLGLEAGAFAAILEDVRDAQRGLDPLDPALHQLEVRVVTQAEVVQPRSLRPGDVTGRGIPLRVSVGVMLDEGLPVLVTRPFDRLANLLPGECHGSRPPLARPDW